MSSTPQPPIQDHSIPSFQIFAPPITPDESSHDEYMRLQNRDGQQAHPLTPNAERRLPGGTVSGSTTASAYHIPPPPAPPTLPARGASGIPGDQTISRYPSAASKKVTHRSASLLQNAGRKMTSRWNSTRSTGRDKRFSFVPRSSRYDILEEPEESDISYAGARAVSRGKGGSVYRGVQVTDDDGPVETFGFDLSSLEGPIGLQQMNGTSSFNAEADRGQKQTQNTLAAEFYQLEADGTFTDGLGGGMVAACLPVDASGNASSSTGADVRRTSRYFGDGLNRGMTIRDVGRMEAKKRNQMVVINGTSASQVLMHDEH